MTISSAFYREFWRTRIDTARQEIAQRRAALDNRIRWGAIQVADTMLDRQIAALEQRELKRDSDYDRIAREILDKHKQFIAAIMRAGQSGAQPSIAQVFTAMAAVLAQPLSYMAYVAKGVVKNFHQTYSYT